jgi:hypothetical protein
VGLPNEEHAICSAWAATQLDELPAAGDGTIVIWDAAFESWDATSGTGNADSETVGARLVSVYDSEMGL